MAGSTTVSPTIPAELSGLYSQSARGVMDLQDLLPMSGFLSMQPRQYSGMTDLEQLGASMVPGLFGASPSLTQSSNIAGRLANPSPWSGVDLSGIGRVSPWGQGTGGSAGGGGSYNQPFGIWTGGGAMEPGGSGEVAFKNFSPRDRLNQDWESGDQYDPTVGGGPGGGGARPVDPPSPVIPPRPRPTPGGGSQETPTGSFQWTRGTTGAGPTQGMGIPMNLGGNGVGMSRGGGSSSSYSGFSGELPERIGAWDQSLNLGRSPAMDQAKLAFESSIAPTISNNFATMGLTHAGAKGEALAKAEAESMLPIMQQIMGLEAQDKGMDVTQRGQDINSLLTRGSQSLQARGQDISQRGQDINALMSQGSQALQARGQDLSSLQAALGGYQGVNDADIQRYMLGLGQAADYGGRERSILDARNQATWEEAMRQFGLGRDALMAPYGQSSNMIGQRTSGKF